ncbi:MAG: hypothetical protein IT480_06510 [Gammaproteobacteria bacterium]|nr:hypothetical protein [Gammaproteobacteria bacterium]
MEQKKPVHPYICTPAYNGQVDGDYAQSLAQAAFVAPAFGMQITAGVLGNVGFIELARNIFAKKFLEEEGLRECTHLFFIDGDLKFDWHAFIGLLKADLPICAGVYRRRQEPEDYPFKPSENPDGGGLWFVEDWLQCDRVPTGFLCIRRDVLETLAKDALRVEIADQPGGVPWLFGLKFEPSGNEIDGKPTTRLIGEDYAFCDRYGAHYGQKVPVWSNLTFSHHGFKGNLYEWLVAQKERADRGEESMLGLPKATDTSSAA